jgi:hypothetical protein
VSNRRLWYKGLKTLCSTTRELVSKMDFMETSCEDGSWIELAQDRVQRQVLVLAVQNV